MPPLFKEGHINSLVLLWKSAAYEMAAWCSTDATRDFKTVTSRFENEGLSFLTIALPSFGKDFQKSLDQGFVDPVSFLGFKRRAGLPLFLGGFLDLIFERGSGVLIDKPSIDAILAVRQLTLLYSKLFIPCSDTRVRKAMRGFIDCEMDVRRGDRHRSRDLNSDFRRMSSLLYARALTKVDRKVFLGEVVPKHGPGATADALYGNRKFSQRTWPRRLEEVFTCSDYLIPSWSYFDQLETVDILEPGSEIPVKVTPVPKTQKTPRIIAIEPTAMQYVQQGLLHILVEELGQDNFLSKFLGFSEQEPNQVLAKFGSQFGSLATLDLSEASDRVSNQLVRDLLVNFPHFAEGVDACRSRKADVPGEGVIRLAKFASMGSALTFPIEAMVFLTIIMLGIEKELRTPISHKTLKSLLGKVRVYGDDIIVPVEYVHSVVSMLEAFGFLVNRSKSFWNGKFRESCGKEYYDGFDVSIVKARRLFPTTRTQGSEVISLVSMRNLFYQQGMHKTCDWLDGEIRKLLSHFPSVLSTSPILGRVGSSISSEKYDSVLHRPLVKGFVVQSRPPIDRLDDSAALLKWFLLKARTSSSVSQEGHLERAGRPQSVNTKLRWTSPT